MEKSKHTAGTEPVLNADFQKTANRVSIVTIIGNLFLSVLKLLALE